MDRAMKNRFINFIKINFPISKYLSCNAEKNITVKDNKKELI